MDTTYANFLLGKAGEMRVASELLLRGHRPCINLIDTGSDMFLETGVSIQVKTSKLTGVRGVGYRTKAYRFQCRHWKRGKPHGLKGVDFIILWGFDTNEFWIVPAQVIANMTSVNFYSKFFPKKRAGRFRETFDRDVFLDNWDILNHKPEPRSNEKR